MKLSIPKLPKFNTFLHKKVDTADFLSVDLNYNSCKVVYFDAENEKISPKSYTSTYKDEGVLTSSDINLLLDKTFKTTSSTTNKCILGLSGPDVFGFILLAKQSRENHNVEISLEEFNAVCEKVKNASISIAKQRWETYYASESEFVPLDLVITEAKVDGVVTENPVGLTGDNIEISAYCSYSKEDYYVYAKKLIKNARLEVLAVTATLYAESKVISEKESNFIIVDIGKKHTEVGVVFGKNLILTKSFDMGGDFFTNSLVEQLNISFAEGNHKKENLSSDLNDIDDDTDKLGDIMFSAGKNWLVALKAVLLNMEGIKSYPNKIYISGGGSLAHIVMELMYEKDWYKDIPMSGHIDIKEVDNSFLKSFMLDSNNLINDRCKFNTASLGLVKLEL